MSENFKIIYGSGGISAQDQGQAAEDTGLNLSLSDLLPDNAGNVLIDGAGDGMALRILSDIPVIHSGLVEESLVLQGTDVHGFAYQTFDTGITLYYPSEMNLQIVLAS